VKDGLAATKEIVADLPGVHVLVLTMHDDEQYSMRPRGRRAGIRRQEQCGHGPPVGNPERRARRAVRLRAGGGAHPQELRRRRRAAQAGDRGLSEREVEVLRLTAEGYTNQEIAERLFLSRKTVDTYRGRIMDKLHLEHRSELVQYALRKGLLHE